MSIHTNSNPSAVNRFRDQTAGHATMAGVQAMRFTCRKCGKVKPCEGRKRITKFHRDGYHCADCAKEEL